MFLRTNARVVEASFLARMALRDIEAYIIYLQLGLLENFKVDHFGRARTLSNLSGFGERTLPIASRHGTSVLRQGPRPFVLVWFGNVPVNVKVSRRFRHFQHRTVHVGGHGDLTSQTGGLR